MTSKDPEQIKAQILKQYLKMTPKSRRLFKEVKNWALEGNGNVGNENNPFFYPYPIYIAKAEGCYLIDVDGNHYLDLQNSKNALFHGRSFLNRATTIQKQAATDGIVANNRQIDEQLELSKMLCKRVPSVEKVHFCRSSSEATMFSIRAARDFTGKKGSYCNRGEYP